MSDDVKAIFRALLRVPVFTVVFYLIFNVTCIGYIYVKTLGASYILQQVAVENNYIPQTEFEGICKYLNPIYKAQMVDDIKIYYTNGNSFSFNSIRKSTTNDGVAAYELDMARIGNYGGVGSQGAFKRAQYGNTVTCGLEVDYIIQWPLSYKETTVGDTGVSGYGRNINTTFKGEAERNAIRADNKHKVRIPLEIKYTVPGLKYYADMRYH